MISLHKDAWRSMLCVWSVYVQCCVFWYVWVHLNGRRINFLFLWCVRKKKPVQSMWVSVCVNVSRSGYAAVWVQRGCNTSRRRADTRRTKSGTHTSQSAPWRRGEMCVKEPEVQLCVSLAIERKQRDTCEVNNVKLNAVIKRLYEAWGRSVGAESEDGVCY